jgi:hypothetical protein
MFQVDEGDSLCGHGIRPVLRLPGIAKAPTLAAA